MDKIIKAERYLEQDKPLKALDLLSSGPLNARALFLKAEALRLLGNFEAAVRDYSSCARLARDKELLAETLLGKAACLRTLGRAAEALRISTQVFALSEKYEFEDLALKARLEKGLALRAQGDLAPALRELNSVLSEYSAKGDRSAVGYLHWALGGIYRLTGDFKKSIGEFKKSAVIARRLKDSSAEGYAWFGLAGVLRISGDVSGCERYYRKAEKLFARSEDIFAKAYVNCGLANALRQKGEYDEALVRYKRAEALYMAINDKPDLGFVKWGLANIYQKRGNLKMALSLFDDALRLFSRYDEKRGELLSRLSGAAILYLLGRKIESVKMFDAAVKDAKKSGLYTYLENFT